VIVIQARNVAEALVKGFYRLKGDVVVLEDTRNGPAYRYPTPVATVMERPRERVLFYGWRDANPFFHFYESLWMLVGRNDIAPLTRYVKQMGEYSDDGVTQNAAYGHRWRRAPTIAPHWGGPIAGERDQLVDIIAELRKKPTTRQCVLQMWDHDRDLATETKDHACNLVVTFQLSVVGALDAVVFCRSNDAIWGCHGANAVHFSVLLEYIARCAELPVGSLTQVSVNYHAYQALYDKMYDKMLLGEEYSTEPYRNNEVSPYPLMSTSRESWDEDVRYFVTHDGRLPGTRDCRDPFFNEVAWPIVRAHDIYKDYNDAGAAIASLYDCRASDWRRACAEWLERRRRNERENQ